MFSTPINIQNKLAVRDGYVEIPDAMRYRQAVTVAQALAAIPGSVVKRESSTQYKLSDQKWIELPAYGRSASQTDWYQTLRALAASNTGF